MILQSHTEWGQRLYQDVTHGWGRMEDVNEFKYLGTTLCKHGSMEGEIRERTVKGRQVMGGLERVMKGRNVSREVKKGIRNSVILPTVSYASDVIIIIIILI